MTLITPEVLSILIIDAIFLVFATIALFLSINIVKKWDITSTSQTQYRLEKQSYLIATIIKYILSLKVLLFLYFIFTQDKLSIYIPGAMCAVGVVNATSYGYYAMILKIINLYLFASWIVLNNIDSKNPKLPYTKVKFAFFIIIYFFLVGEIFLEFMEFYSLDPAKIVSCCGTVFSATSDSSIASLFTISNRWIVSIFYINFFVILISYISKNKLIFLISNILFIFSSIFSLIKFFGTYIYELPTHHCPFCMLQKDYHYIGYVLYISLFIGTFSAIGYCISKEERYKKTSLLFDTIYTLIVSLYPLVFFIKNGVWL